MLFPLSGFAPMNVTGWLKDFKIVKNWGLNHERCHTCTPPEASILAADLLGFYFQPELPFWGTWLGENDEKYNEAEAAQDFLTVEGFNILEEYAGHPSFVMMSMGNELWGNPEALNELMGSYKAVRPDILYTQGSNNFQWMPNIQPNDDFFSGVRFFNRETNQRLLCSVRCSLRDMFRRADLLQIGITMQQSILLRPARVRWLRLTEL